MMMILVHHHHPNLQWKPQFWARGHVLQLLAMKVEAHQHPAAAAAIPHCLCEGIARRLLPLNYG